MADVKVTQLSASNGNAVFEAMHPDFPGCLAQGGSEGEARASLQRMVSAVLRLRSAKSESMSSAVAEVRGVAWQVLLGEPRTGVPSTADQVPTRRTLLPA